MTARRVTPIMRAWKFLRRRGPLALVQRVWLELWRRILTPPVARPPRRTRALKARRSVEITAGMDFPFEGQKISGSLQVVGWAQSHTGITAIDIYVDGLIRAKTRTDIERPDLNERPDHRPGTAKPGFVATIDIATLTAGEHTLTLAIHAHSGATALIDRQFILIQSQKRYHAYFLHRLWGEPEKEDLRSRLRRAGRTIMFELWVDARGGVDPEPVIRSLLSQDYPHWTCHVVADTGVHLLPQDLADDQSIRINVHRGFELQNTEESDREPPLCAFLSAYEILAPDALHKVADYCLQHPNGDLLYTDHDRITLGGLHTEPVFGPDWSPDRVLSHNYCGCVFWCRKDPALTSIVLQALAGGGRAWRFDLLLRLSERATHIGHLAEVTWSQARDFEDGALDDECTVVRHALARRGVSARVIPTHRPAIRHIDWRIQADWPKVSVIIPTTGKIEHLRPCVESILQHTRYPDVELLFIDNGRGKHPEGIAYLRHKGLRVLERNEPFNWSRLNNIGARVTNGEVLLFLNDDVEVCDPQWLEEMVGNVMRPEIGTVGARLLYPNGFIQHAGVFLVGFGSGADHYMYKLPRDVPAYQQLEHVTREVAANTGACLSVRRDVFERVNGFDETLVIANNDIDFCLRVSAVGLRNLWTPHATLIHHESLTRKETNVQSDNEKMWARWNTRFEAGDPYFNPNLLQKAYDGSPDFDRPRRVTLLRKPVTDDEYGVNLADGIGSSRGQIEVMRGVAMAMEAVGVPFVILAPRVRRPKYQNDDSWALRVARKPRYPANLIGMNGDVVALVRTAAFKQLSRHRYTIGFLGSELCDLPDRVLRKFDEVWVPSKFLFDKISPETPVPVFQIPQPVSKHAGPYLGRGYFGLPVDRVLFLSRSDGASALPGKNLEGVLRAFQQAFPQSAPRASLVIQARGNSAEDLEALRRRIDGQNNIYIIDRVLSAYESDSLIANCDCFVSLYREEGFGLYIAKAMALAKPVIATGWSGTIDFMNDRNAALVPYELITREHVGQAPGPRSETWAERDLEHAVEWMRRLASDANLRMLLGEAAEETVSDHLSPVVVGEMIRARLAQLKRSGKLNRKDIR